MVVASALMAAAIDFLAGRSNAAGPDALRAVDSTDATSFPLTASAAIAGLVSFSCDGAGVETGCFLGFELSFLLPGLFAAADAGGCVADDDDGAGAGLAFAIFSCTRAFSRSRSSSCCFRICQMLTAGAAELPEATCLRGASEDTDAEGPGIGAVEGDGSTALPACFSPGLVAVADNVPVGTAPATGALAALLGPLVDGCEEVLGSLLGDPCCVYVDTPGVSGADTFFTDELSPLLTTGVADAEETEAAPASPFCA